VNNHLFKLLENLVALLRLYVQKLNHTCVEMVNALEIEDFVESNYHAQ
jgi:hypothetical protein